MSNWPDIDRSHKGAWDLFDRCFGTTRWANQTGSMLVVVPGRRRLRIGDRFVIAGVWRATPIPRALPHQEFVVTDLEPDEDGLLVTIDPPLIPSETVRVTAASGAMLCPVEHRWVNYE